MMIYLVSTPLQLINAIEARNYFGPDGDSDHQLLIANFKYNTQRQMEKILELYPWDRAVFLLKKRHEELQGVTLLWHHLIFPFKERLVARKVAGFIEDYISTPISTVFLGNYASRLFYKIAQLFRGEKILLDDGAGTLETYNLRLKELSSGVPHPWNKRLSLIKRAELLILGIKRSVVPQNIRFFSCFLEVPDNPAVIKNTYSLFSGLAGNKEREPVVYFVGSPLVELGILEINTFRKAILKIREYYSERGLAFVYINHRLEKEGKLSAPHQEINTRSFALPFELELILGTSMPAVVASFYSSALVTTFRIFNSSMEINAFDIRELDVTKVDPSEMNEIYRVYSNYSSESFRVLGIPGV
jgi:hypothetical protein